MVIYLLIAILSVVQSLFGVGLLLFGTPILLMLGCDYSEALLYLLPSSAVLSWSQVRDNFEIVLDGNYRRLFFMICLPTLFLGMFITRFFDLKWEIKIFIIAMLLFSFCMRSFGFLREKLATWMKGHLIPTIALMGLVHGLANMGGSILSALISSLYRDKIKILAGVSFSYAFMATFQLMVLIAMGGVLFKMNYLAGPVIAISVRYLIGKRVFAFTSEERYQKMINGFILATAILLLINL